MNTCKNCVFFKEPTKYRAIQCKMIRISKDSITQLWDKHVTADTEILDKTSVMLTQSDETAESYLLHSTGSVELNTRVCGTCNLVENSNNDVNENSDNVFADASDDFGLTVYVGENFGCIHFKQKE